MKPVITAKLWCDDHKEDFEEELWYHLQEGWVYSGDDCFLMATLETRACLLRQSIDKTLDTDTWFVYVYAGSLKRVLDLIPFPKKYVAFRRNNGPIKFYELEKLLAKI